MALSSVPRLSPEQSGIRIQPPLLPENLGSLVTVQGGWGQPERETRLGGGGPPPCSPWTCWTRPGSLKLPSPGPFRRGSGWSCEPCLRPVKSGREELNPRLPDALGSSSCLGTGRFPWPVRPATPPVGGCAWDSGKASSGRHLVATSWYCNPLSQAGRPAKPLSRVQRCDPGDCSPPGSSVRGIFHARILEWHRVYGTEETGSRLSFQVTKTKTWPDEETTASAPVAATRMHQGHHCNSIRLSTCLQPLLHQEWASQVVQW